MNTHYKLGLAMLVGLTRTDSACGMERAPLVSGMKAQQTTTTVRATLQRMRLGRRKRFGGC